MWKEMTRHCSTIIQEGLLLMLVLNSIMSSFRTRLCYIYVTAMTIGVSYASVEVEVEVEVEVLKTLHSSPNYQFRHLCTANITPRYRN
jgi:hypothetical protein